MDRATCLRASHRQVCPTVGGTNAGNGPYTRNPVWEREKGQSPKGNRLRTCWGRSSRCGASSCNGTSQTPHERTIVYRKWADSSNRFLHGTAWDTMGGRVA